MGKVIVVTLYKHRRTRGGCWTGSAGATGLRSIRSCSTSNRGAGRFSTSHTSSHTRGKVVVENKALLGCTRNTYESLDHGFRHADFVIHFEDDDAPGRDCLRYFEWARNRFEADKDVFSVSAYTKSRVGPEHYYTARRVRWFTPWGWGTWRDRWVEMRENWAFGAPHSWDVGANRLRGNRCQIQPDLARAQNIGAEDAPTVPVRNGTATTSGTSLGPGPCRST